MCNLLCIFKKKKKNFLRVKVKKIRTRVRVGVKKRFIQRDFYNNICSLLEV